MKNNDIKLAIIGLGYVGLPLAIEFGKKRNVLGFDINHKRVQELKNFYDKTLEVGPEDFQESINLKFTSNQRNLSSCNFFIVTVPTPIDKENIPDLEPLKQASKTVGKNLKSGDIVVYESTVFPGATEEICVPILEELSNLSFNTDFFVGYSPERINPGDKKHRLTSIVKVTSGSTPITADIIDNLYKSIVSVGTHKVSSIKVAEAAKVIENTQRDINIGLINELAIIFNKLNIDTEEVLNAAGTKWNFLPFKPGLVGGHCIGVDPYYLTHKAQLIGYEPELILAGRKLNDSMAKYVSDTLINSMKFNKISIVNSKVLIMGITFKENCPDYRNTKVVDMVHELSNKGLEVDCFDPWVDYKNATQDLHINLIKSPITASYSAIILAVAHQEFIDMGYEQIKSLGKENSLIYDLKYVLSQKHSDIRL
jgi:UDP-N-acetyl-D-galactosamine dehydrogenase